MKINFLHVKLSVFLLFLLATFPTLAQRNITGQFYDYSSIGRQKTIYRLSYSNIFVKFQPNTTDAEITSILRAAGVKAEDGEYSQNPATNRDGYVRPALIGVNKPEVVKEILTKLEANPKVVAANPFIVWNGEKTEANQMGITDEFYVKLKPNTTLDELRALVAVSNTRIKQQYPYNAATYILIADKASNGNALEMANLFFESTKFEYAAVDFHMRPTYEGYNPKPVDIKGVKDIQGTQATVTDPLWPWQYSHRISPAGIPGGQYPVSVRDSRAAFPGAPGPIASDMPWNTDASMRVDEAWDIATTAGLGVRVAIIDNGVDRGHPDLVANMSPLGFDPANPTNLGNAIGTAPGDHGTTCAGVVAAAANNGIGVAGVAHRATIVPIQIFTTNNAGIAAAVDWSWQVANVDVSSNSYGFPAANTNPAFDIPVITDAFNRALSLGRGGKGQVIIASAGNANLPISGYPGRIPGIISSIASNAGATRAGFSQFGGGADIAAPGNQILTTDRRDIAPFQGYTSDEYCLIDGTSFSCPNTAGVAALILGIGPNLTRQEVRAFIEGTGRKVAAGAPYVCGSEPNGSWGQQLGYGIVDAYEACRQAAARVNNPVCVQQFYAAPVSSFDDGSFSDNYRKGQNCLYTISIPATSRISASFSSFALAAGDVLEVYDNSSGTGLPIRRFTSVNPGANVSVATGAMTFRFITLPSSPTAAGWSVCYRADDRPEGDFTVNVNSGCVGNAFTFTPTVAALSTVNEFRWDFGAGAIPQTASTTTITPVTTTYTTAGAKTVTLTLVGPAGSTVVTKANLITVSPSFATPINEGFLVPGTPANWEATATGNPGWLTQSGNPVLARGGGFAESQRAVAFLCFLNQWPAGATGFFATPPLNMVAMNTPHVVFDVAHQPFGSLAANQDRLQVQVSIDCGATWTTVYNKQSVDANPNLSLATVPTLTGAEFRPQNANQWRREIVPIPTAANRDAVRVRFVGISGFGNNIFVDNINITNIVPPGFVNVFGSANTAPFTATTVSGTQINLTWSDNSSSETGFLVQRTTTPGIAASYTTVAILPPNTSSYLDGGLANNTAYTYRLFALNGSEVSSAAVSGLPLAAPVAGIEAFTLIARTTTTPGAIPPPGGSLVFEPFTGCALPAGWTNVRAAGGATEGWQFGNAAAIPGVMPIYATNSNFNGCYAFFNSDGSDDGLAEDLSLVSPLINATGFNSMYLSFNGVFRGGAGGRISVDVSADNGTTWTNKYDDAVAGTRAFNPLIALPEISNLATGRIRFRWTGNWSWAVAIDNVAVFNAIPGPSNLVATLALPNTANLTWTDNTTGETGFDIERSTTSATTGFAVVGTAAANATAFTHTNGVISGPVNWYRVVARMSPTQTTDPSNSASVITMAAPTNLTVTPTSPNPFGFALAWVDNTTLETGYVVERSTSAATGFTVIATLPANATSHNDFTGLVENTRYFYRVAATLNSFNSAYSNVASGVTGLTAPSDATAAGFSPNANIIRWRDNSNGESGFRIDASVISGSGFYFAGFAPANSTSFVHAGLNPDVKLFYRVSPSGLLGNIAAFSNEATATTYPAAATNLNATPISSSEVRLNWVDNSTTEIGYEIYRSMSATGPFTLLDRVQRNNATTYTDVTAVFGVPNFYQVRAYRDRTLDEFSFFSNTASATPMFPAPVLSVSFVGIDRIVLEWTDNTPDETGFVVERTTRAENIGGVLTPLAFDVIETVGAGVTTFTNTGLSRNTTYYYRVRAIKGTLSSAFSNIVNGITRTGAPSNIGLNLKGTAGNGLVRLNWTAVTDPDVVFEVYYFAENKTNTLAATVPTTSAVITGLENGVDHWFRIKAVSKSSGLKSDYSNTVELRPSIVLGTDDNLTSQGFEIYPNPTASEFTLKLEQTTKPVSVTVVSVTGQVVHAQKFNEFGGSETINLGAISSGVYVVRVETENGSYQKRLQVVK